MFLFNQMLKTFFFSPFLPISNNQSHTPEFQCEKLLQYDVFSKNIICCNKKIYFANEQLVV